ncbi:pyridoxal 5'-phosphate synthase glutaminase subunit PdxT [Tomitella biformata]|uniref:pyridoxal 5'-phosphate synthase glutaminase subunit PdxT n=1 Tax=Tomitella biformata TaxID=630403 RepID=UPI0004666E35|nr:pyridoxal 5'-phosphate synthase glutaminase subunit PdxT [Tomitella biformata]
MGILALQGAVREHALALADLGVETLEVRTPAQLDRVDGLVLPGGESTAMSRLLKIFAMVEPLREAVAAGLPMYGSCAGMILLASEVLDTRADAVNFGAIDITVRRNAFGRQIDSFETALPCVGMPDGPFPAVFIRAPWVERCGPDVEVLAAVEIEGVLRPVAVRQGTAVATSFHPEMGHDRRFHQLFLEIVGAAR